MAFIWDQFHSECARYVWWAWKLELFFIPYHYLPWTNELMKILPKGRPDLFILLFQCHGCWWPGTHFTKGLWAPNTDLEKIMFLLKNDRIRFQFCCTWQLKINLQESKMSQRLQFWAHKYIWKWNSWNQDIISNIMNSIFLERLQYSSFKTRIVKANMILNARSQGISSSGVYIFTHQPESGSRGIVVAWWAGGRYLTRDSPSIWCLCAFFSISFQFYVPLYVQIEKLDNFMCLLEFECIKRLTAHSQAIPASHRYHSHGRSFYRIVVRLGGDKSWGRISDEFVHGRCGSLIKRLTS